MSQFNYCTIPDKSGPIRVQSTFSLLCFSLLLLSSASSPHSLSSFSEAMAATTPTHRSLSLHLFPFLFLSPSSFFLLPTSLDDHRNSRWLAGPRPEAYKVGARHIQASPSSPAARLDLASPEAGELRARSGLARRRGARGSPDADRATSQRHGRHHFKEEASPGSHEEGGGRGGRSEEGAGGEQTEREKLWIFSRCGHGFRKERERVRG